MKSCELCNAQAFLYCSSDSAFLCYKCDAMVHHANFIVARHRRHYICTVCNSITDRGFSGAGGDFHRISDICPSCPSPEDDGGDLDSISSSSSCSSACISSTTGDGCGERRSGDGGKAEGIFVNWCCKLGISAVGLTVRMACRAMRVFIDRWTDLPFRVCLAASMWLGLRLAGVGCGKVVLKRLEEVSGVPAKIILATEGKVERAVRRRPRRRRLELEEGWDES